MGNPAHPPTLMASSGFQGDTIIYGKDPSFDSTVNFYIGVKNIVIDTTGIDKEATIAQLERSVSQATQLTNIVFNMPNDSSHKGIVMQYGGSGTMMGDLTFNGGAVGLEMGDQQYEAKSLSFNSCHTGISVSHCFDCVFNNCNFANVGTGIDMTTGQVGVVILLDSSAKDSGPVISTHSSTSGDHTIVIENFYAGDGVDQVVVVDGDTLLGETVTDAWVYGNVFTADGA